MFVIHTTTLLIESINTTINFSKFILNREGKDMIERITKHDKQNNVLQMLNEDKGLVAWEEQEKDLDLWSTNKTV